MVTPLPIFRPGQIPINEEMLIDNFDLPKTFFIEFEFQLSREQRGMIFLEGMKFDTIDTNNGIILNKVPNPYRKSPLPRLKVTLT